MQTASSANFLGLLARVSDVLAGYAMVCAYYGYGPFSNIGIIVSLVACSMCLGASRNLWRSVFALELHPDMVSWSNRGKATKPFLLACVLCGCGLLAAMSAGMSSFVCAAIIASLGLFDACALVRMTLPSAVVQGLGRAMSVLLGMSAYPLLEVAVYNPQPLIPAILTGLFCTAVLLGVPARGKDTSKSAVLFSALAGVSVTIACIYIIPESFFTIWVLVPAWVVMVLALLQGFFGRRGNNGFTWAAVSESSVPLLQGAALCGFTAEWGWKAGKYVLVAFGLLFLISIIDAANRVSRTMRV